MQYLIDTHVFLWFVSNARELSQTATHSYPLGFPRFAATSHVVYGVVQDRD